MAYIGAGITRFNTADELTVTGDAQIDTTTLVVDSTNNRVGVGTSSPSTLLHLDASADGRVARFGSGTSDTGGMYVTHNSGSTRSFEVSADNILILDADRSNGRGSSRLQFNVDGSERMRIDSSGNVAIGGTNTSFGKFSVRGGFVYINEDNANTNQIYIRSDLGGDPAIQVATSHALKLFTSNQERMRIDSSGNVGIGISAPSAGLHIDNPNNGAITAILDTDNSAVKMVFRNNTETGNNVQIGADGSNLVSLTNGSERLRIDSSGNLLVGTTDTTLYNNTTGGGFKTGGDLRTDMARQGDIVATMNRTGNSDGTILQFRKDGTDVGSIGVNTDRLFIGDSAFGGIAFPAGGSGVLPAGGAGALNDNTHDLGNSSTRFKDLYLSGGAYLGGTGSANKLDDYEEGTWTATLKGLTSDPSSAVTATGEYTKIGRMVYVQITFSNVNTTGAAGNVFVSGTPFAPNNSNAASGTCAAYSFDFPNGRTSLSVQPGGDDLFIYVSGDSTTWDGLKHAPGTARYLEISAQYTVA